MQKIKITGLQLQFPLKIMITGLKWWVLWFVKFKIPRLKLILVNNCIVNE